MSKIDTFASVAALAPMRRAAVSATGAFAGIDGRAFVGAVAFLLAAINTAGTNPTLAVKIQTSPDVSRAAAPEYSGTGDGFLGNLEAGPDPVAETITITATSATEFSVVGGTSGSLGTATVGVPFVSAQIKFTIFAGAVAFVADDAFTVATLARTWTDAVDGAFSGFDFARVVLNADEEARYFRGHATIGGTSSPAYSVALAAMGLEA